MTDLIDKEELIKEINILIKNNKDDSDIYDYYDYGFLNGLSEGYLRILDLIEGDIK